MSTAAQVRAKWNTLILEHATVSAYTSRRYTLEPLQDTADQVGALKDSTSKKIDFINLVATRKENNVAGCGFREYVHTVNVYCTMEALPQTNQTELIDRMDTINDLVYSELGVNWDGILNGYYTIVTANSEPEEIQVGGVDCIRMQLSYEGIDRVST